MSLLEDGLVTKEEFRLAITCGFIVGGLIALLLFGTRGV